MRDWFKDFFSVKSWLDTLRMLGILFAFIGIAMGLFSFGRHLYFQQNGASAPGEIYAMYYQGAAVMPPQENGGVGFSFTWSNQVHTYIRFTTDNAEEISAPIHYLSSNMRVGQQLNVFYFPDNPYRFITDLPDPFLMYGAFAGIGLLITGAFVVVKLVKKRRHRHRPNIPDFEWRPL